MVDFGSIGRNAEQCTALPHGLFWKQSRHGGGVGRASKFICVCCQLALYVSISSWRRLHNAGQNDYHPREVTSFHPPEQTGADVFTWMCEKSRLASTGLGLDPGERSSQQRTRERRRFRSPQAGWHASRLIGHEVSGDGNHVVDMPDAIDIVRVAAAWRAGWKLILARFGQRRPRCDR